MPGGQLTDNADPDLLCVMPSILVKLQCTGQGLSAANLCEFTTSRLSPWPRVYRSTTAEVSRYSHYSPRTT